MKKCSYCNEKVKKGEGTYYRGKYLHKHCKYLRKYNNKKK